MPLIETLTLLASLGSALQGVRLNKAEERTADKNETSAALLLSYEYVKSSQDWATNQNASLNGRLQTLVISAGVIVAGISVLADDGAELDSPLYIAAMIVFGLMALAGALLTTARPLLIATQDVVTRQATLDEGAFLRDLIAEAGRFERANRRLIATKTAALGLTSLGFGALAILLGVWAIAG